jgi:hypothetical protein
MMNRIKFMQTGRIVKEIICQWLVYSRDGRHPFKL